MGGGAMRTAAKAAAFAGYRSTAARRATTLPPAASVSTVHVAVEGENAPLISSISSEKSAGHPAKSQFPAWDGWEFAGGREEQSAAVSDRMMDLMNPPPRLVFGPAPTLEEAKEATADLKEAIEMVYFSSGTVEEPVKVGQVSDRGETVAILPSMPKHVIQAFSLLQGSPEAQSVVASLASDKNVWDAVMKNDMVVEFCNKHQSVVLPPESDVAPEESVGENEAPEGFSGTAGSPDKDISQVSAFFTDVVQNIKAKMSEMVSSISGFLQDFIGSSSDVGHGRTKTSTSTSENYVDIGVGASFIALAVAAILVVLLKRGSSRD